LQVALTPFELNNGTANVGASIGIEQVLPQDDFVNALVRADQAMYQIKHAGKNGAALGATPLTDFFNGA
jgi:PleD family two-component response regulator